MAPLLAPLLTEYQALPLLLVLSKPLWSKIPMDLSLIPPWQLLSVGAKTTALLIPQANLFRLLSLYPTLALYSLPCPLSGLANYLKENAKGCAANGFKISSFINKNKIAFSLRTNEFSLKR
jgi:hypothetical protein